MKNVGTRRRKVRLETVRFVGFGVAGIFVAITAIGIASSPRLGALLCGAGVVVFVVLARPRYALGGLIFIRTLTESSYVPEGFGWYLNVAISALAVVLLLRLTLTGSVRLGRIAIASAAFGLGTGAIAVAAWGFDTGVLGDSLRLASVVLVAICASEVVRREGSRAVLSTTVVAVVPSAALAFFGWLGKVPGLYSPGTGRGYGTLTHPVAAAGLFSVAFVLALFLVLVERRRRHWYSLGLIGLGLVSTVSLGGLATLAVGVGVLLVGISGVKGRGATVALLTVLVFGGAALFGSSLGARLADLQNTQSYADAAQGASGNSLDWRFRNWNALLDIWQERPIQGWGWGATSAYLRPLGELPHSSPVRILVEGGAIGFAMAAFILVAAVVVAVRQLATASRNYGVLRMALVCALVTNSLSSNTTDYIPMLMVFVVGWACGEDNAGAAKAGEPRSPSRVRVERRLKFDPRDQVGPLTPNEHGSRSRREI